MAWGVVTVKAQRLQFIEEHERNEESLSELCRRFGISRKTGYKWLERFESGGVEALEDRPRAPLTTPHRLEQELERRIVETRKEHPRWGPKKLRAVLERATPTGHVPAVSTIGAVLKRNGLIVESRRKLRVPLHPLPLAPSTGPNELWCADYKGDFALLGSRQRCYPLTISDAYARYLLKSEVLLSTAHESAHVHFERAFREYGLPRRLRTDNGTPFASKAPGGLSALSIWWIKLGIVPERIEPGEPTQNGQHERIHRTMLEAIVPPENTVERQQARMDRFRYEYNELRPHEALGQTPPAKHYAVSVRPYPAILKSPDYGSAFEVRTISESGKLKWGGQQMHLTKLLGRELVGLRQQPDETWAVFFGPVKLGTIDPRRPDALFSRA